MRPGFRRAISVGLHGGLIVWANYAAFWLRFDGTIPAEHYPLFVVMLPWLLLIRVAVFVPLRMFDGLWRYTSLYDLKKIVSSVLISTAAFFGVTALIVGAPPYPRSIFIVDSVLLVCLMTAARLSQRVFQGLRQQSGARRVLIFGAGDAGELIIRDMMNDPERHFEPVAFVDDSPRKAGASIHGVPVAGNRDALRQIIERYAPQEALLAIPSAGPVLIRDIVKSLQPYDLPIKTLPRLRDLSGCQVGVWQIRNLSVEDLLDRAPVGLDQSRVHALIQDRVVLITGAGGSIGSEIARQVLAALPTDIVLYDHYENSLFDRVNELESQNPTQVRIHPVIGDVTDETRLDQIFSEHRPALVFHAAAHKHVPLMEQNPCEAVKNNVRGTRLVAEAAIRWGVERFVQISTDKAVHPSSVMGASKLAAELIVRELGEGADTKFVTVRFGNVLGSNGSVIPRFLDQIKKGGPVTVTDPRMRRFFMLIPEAVQLVLMASALEGGAIYVLDMGDQISVVELARSLIRLSGFVPDLDISIVYTGIRPGEKLFEELVAGDERAEPSEVEKILKVTPVSPRSAAFLRRQIPALERAAADGDTPLTLRLLHELIPAFTPAVDPNPVVVKSAAVSSSVS